MATETATLTWVRDPRDKSWVAERAGYRLARTTGLSYADAYVTQGNERFAAGDYSAAVESYRRALELKNDCPEAHNNLGVALALEGDRIQAVAAFRAALRDRPQWPTARANLAEALASTPPPETETETEKETETNSESSQAASESPPTEIAQITPPETTPVGEAEQTEPTADLFPQTIPSDKEDSPEVPFFEEFAPVATGHQFAPLSPQSFSLAGFTELAKDAFEDAATPPAEPLESPPADLVKPLLTPEPPQVTQAFAAVRDLIDQETRAIPASPSSPPPSDDAPVPIRRTEANSGISFLADTFNAEEESAVVEVPATMERAPDARRGDTAAELNVAEFRNLLNAGALSPDELLDFDSPRPTPIRPRVTQAFAAVRNLIDQEIKPAGSTTSSPPTSPSPGNFALDIPDPSLTVFQEAVDQEDARRATRATVMGAIPPPDATFPRPGVTQAFAVLRDQFDVETKSSPPPAAALFPPIQPESIVTPPPATTPPIGRPDPDPPFEAVASIIPMPPRTAQTIPSASPSLPTVGDAVSTEPHPPEDERTLRAKLERNPNDPTLLRRLAEQLARRGAFREASIYLDRAARLTPDEAGVWLEWSSVLVGLRRLDEAIDALGHAIERPHSAPAWLIAKAHRNLADLLRVRRRLDQIIADATEAARQRPNEAQPVITLALAQTARGRFEEAIASYETALSLQPDASAELLVNLGLLHARLSRLDRARDCLRQALTRRPDLAEAHEALADLLENPASDWRFVEIVPEPVPSLHARSDSSRFVVSPAAPSAAPANRLSAAAVPTTSPASTSTAPPSSPPAPPAASAPPVSSRADRPNTQMLDLDSISQLVAASMRGALASPAPSAPAVSAPPVGPASAPVPPPPELPRAAPPRPGRVLRPVELIEPESPPASATSAGDPTKAKLKPTDVVRPLASFDWSMLDVEPTPPRPRTTPSRPIAPPRQT